MILIIDPLVHVHSVAYLYMYVITSDAGSSENLLDRGASDSTLHK